MICETILNNFRYTKIYRREGLLSSREPTKEGHLQLLHRAAQRCGVWLKSGELFIREPLGCSSCSRGRRSTYLFPGFWSTRSLAGQ